MARYRTVILMGPTGSGKTPFGEYLERHGLWNARCHHFDFGENLRKTAYSDNGNGFSVMEKNFLKDVLEKGVLLENESFKIALRILETFILEKGVQGDDYLLMNGLPRHVGQAHGLEPMIDVQHIIHLDCSVDTVFTRILTNAGGDRTDRTDDDIALVKEKLRIFNERTAPIKEFYTGKGADLFNFPITAEMKPAELYTLIQGQE